MSVDNLFNTLMLANVSALHTRIANNIGGDPLPPQGWTQSQTQTPAQSAASSAQAAATDADDAPSMQRLLSGAALPNLLGRSPNVPASLSLIGLRLPGANGDLQGQSGSAMSQTASGQAGTGTSPMQTVASPSAAAAMAALAGDAETGSAGTPGLSGGARAAQQPAAVRGALGAQPNAGVPTDSERATSAPAVRRDAATGEPASTAARTVAEPNPRATADRPAMAVPIERAVTGAALDRAVAGAEIWALAGLAAADGQSERAGVISSFILNAAMIPGWPYPKPIELALGRKTVPDPLPMPHAAIDENEALTFLANFGAKQGLLSRIRELLNRMAQRARLLLGLAVMVTSLVLALRSLRDEIEALEDERLALEQAPGRGRRMLTG